MKKFTLIVWFETNEGGESKIYNIEARGKHKAAAKLAALLYHTNFRSIYTL